MTVCCGFLINRVQQIQHLNQTVRTQVEELAHQQRQLLVGNFTGTEGFYIMDVGSATPIA